MSPPRSTAILPDNSDSDRTIGGDPEATTVSLTVTREIRVSRKLLPSARVFKFQMEFQYHSDVTNKQRFALKWFRAALLADLALLRTAWAQRVGRVSH